VRLPRAAAGQRHPGARRSRRRRRGPGAPGAAVHPAGVAGGACEGEVRSRLRLWWGCWQGALVQCVHGTNGTGPLFAFSVLVPLPFARPTAPHLRFACSLTAHCPEPRPAAPPCRVAAFNLASLLLQWQLDGQLPAGCPTFLEQPLVKAEQTRCVRLHAARD